MFFELHIDASHSPESVIAKWDEIFAALGYEHVPHRAFPQDLSLGPAGDPRITALRAPRTLSPYNLTLWCHLQYPGRGETWKILASCGMDDFDPSRRRFRFDVESKATDLVHEDARQQRRVSFLLLARRLSEEFGIEIEGQESISAETCFLYREGREELGAWGEIGECSAYYEHDSRIHSETKGRVSKDPYGFVCGPDGQGIAKIRHCLICGQVLDTEQEPVLPVEVRREWAERCLTFNSLADVERELGPPDLRTDPVQPDNERWKRQFPETEGELYYLDLHPDAALIFREYRDGPVCFHDGLKIGDGDR